MLGSIPVAQWHNLRKNFQPPAYMAEERIDMGPPQSVAAEQKQFKKGIDEISSPQFGQKCLAYRLTSQQTPASPEPRC